MTKPEEQFLLSTLLKTLHSDYTEGIFPSFVKQCESENRFDLLAYREEGPQFVYLVRTFRQRNGQPSDTRQRWRDA